MINPVTLVIAMWQVSIIYASLLILLILIPFYSLE